jgi:Protein of unknown function (DUF3617)
MKVTLLVVLTVLTGATTLAAQSPIRPGRWETVMQMEMPNLPVKMPEMKSTRCVTPEQAKDPASSLPRGPQDGRGGANDCKVSDYKVSDKTVTWQMACTTPQPMTSTGEMTFTDDSYTGLMKMNSTQGVMSMKVSGTRLGDCTP